MSARTIIQLKCTGGDNMSEKMLESPSVKVVDFGPSLQALVEDLRDTMWNYDICVGLAAPQIGVPLRVAVVNWERNSRDDDLILINPHIISVTGKKDVKRESCMSVWGLCGNVERRSKVDMSYLDGSFTPQRAAFDGFGARVIQHEVDHLDGRLYPERMRAGGTLESIEIFDNLSWKAEES